MNRTEWMQRVVKQATGKRIPWWLLPLVFLSNYIDDIYRWIFGG